MKELEELEKLFLGLLFMAHMPIYFFLRSRNLDLNAMLAPSHAMIALVHALLIAFLYAVGISLWTHAKYAEAARYLTNRIRIMR